MKGTAKLKSEVDSDWKLFLSDVNNCEGLHPIIRGHISLSTYEDFESTATRHGIFTEVLDEFTKWRLDVIINE